MNLENHSLLKAFYFGALEEDQRLKVERDLLTDPEALIDYLDLKRSMESALEGPQVPSKKLWMRLNARISPRKRIIFSLSVGAAIAASLLIFSILILKPKTEIKTLSGGPEVLFDSKHELPLNSNVL